MRKKSFWVAWIVFLCLQLLFSFIAEAKFTSEMNESIEVMGRRMDEDGVPANQRSNITSALRDVRSNVSSFVHLTSYTIILVSGFMVLLAFNDKRKEDVSESNEA